MYSLSDFQIPKIPDITLDTGGLHKNRLQQSLHILRNGLILAACKEQFLKMLTCHGAFHQLLVQILQTVQLRISGSTRSGG